MKLLIAIIIPIAVFLTVILSLDNFTQIAREEILFFASILGLITLLISTIDIINNRRDAELTISNGLSLLKGLMESMKSSGLGRILLIIVGGVSSVYILYYVFLAFIVILIFIGVIGVH